MSAESDSRDRAAKFKDASDAGTPSEPVSRDASNDLTDAGSWDPERLADLIGRTVVEDPGSPLWHDKRSAEWIAKDDLMAAARESRRTQRRTSADASHVLAMGEELRLRATARRLTLTRRSGRPTERAPLVGGTPARVLQHALERNSTPYVDLAVAAGVGRDLWEEPCDAWIDLPNDLEPARYIALKVSGDSMAPLMHTGDTILVQLDAPLRRDRVVVARHPEDGYICKVVRRIRSATIELASLDPARPLITIPRDERLIVGMVAVVWCMHNDHGRPPNVTRPLP